jgi:hypothetical protein
MTEELNATSAPPKADQLAGYLLYVGSLVSILFMLLHPNVAAHSSDLAMAELMRESSLAKLVHGTLLLVLAFIFYAVERFSVRLTANGLESGLGLTFYKLGFIGLVIAAMICGFVVPDLGAQYATKVGPEQLVFFDLARLTGTATEVFSKLGSIANGLAAVFWGVSMLRVKGQVRIFGIGFICIGLAIAASILLGLKLNVYGMTLIVVGLSIWQALMGRLLIKANW